LKQREEKIKNKIKLGKSRINSPQRPLLGELKMRIVYALMNYTHHPLRMHRRETKL